MFDAIPWRKSNREMARFRSELGSLFGRFFDPDAPLAKDLSGMDTLSPKVDVKEDSSRFTVKAELPGVEVKDIELTLDGRTLTLKGEKKQETEREEENVYRLERNYGYFSRAIALPADVDQEAVDAVYKKGVLTVKLQKTAVDESKKIEIKTS